MQKNPKTFTSHREFLAWASDCPIRNEPIIPTQKISRVEKNDLYWYFSESPSRIRLLMTSTVPLSEYEREMGINVPGGDE